MLPDQSPLAFVVIFAALAAVGLLFAGRDLFAAARRRSDPACARCGEPYSPATWPTRSQRQSAGGAFVAVPVCPRCGQAWTPAGQP